MSCVRNISSLGVPFFDVAAKNQLIALMQMKEGVQMMSNELTQVVNENKLLKDEVKTLHRKVDRLKRKLQENEKVTDNSVFMVQVKSEEVEKDNTIMLDSVEERNGNRGTSTTKGRHQSPSSASVCRNEEPENDRPDQTPTMAANADGTWYVCDVRDFDDGCGVNPNGDSGSQGRIQHSREDHRGPGGSSAEGNPPAVEEEDINVVILDEDSFADFHEETPFQRDCENTWIVPPGEAYQAMNVDNYVCNRDQYGKPAIFKSPFNGKVPKTERVRDIKKAPGEYRFKCDICNKSFRLRQYFRVHMRIHTGEKPFQCSYCLKAFSQKSSLNIHIRTHTGERPYACTMCGKAFAVKSSLDVHIRTHTGEKPFVCAVCSRAFSLRSSLNAHMRNHAAGHRYQPSMLSEVLEERQQMDGLMESQERQLPPT